MKLYGSYFLLLITIFTGFTALLVMAGWVLHIPMLVQMSPTFAPMQFNAALVILLWSFVLQAVDVHSRKLSLVLSASMIFFLLLTLSEYLFKINLGIDTLFIHPVIQTDTSHLERMAPNTALALLMIGCALFLLHRGSIGVLSHYTMLTITLLGVAALSLGMTLLIGYSNNLETAYTWGNFTIMAVHTALCIVLLSVSILVKIWNKEVNRLFFAPMAVVSGGIIITISLSLAIYSKENISFENTLQEKANNFASITKAQLDNFYSSLERMSERWSDSKGSAKELLKHDAQKYLKDFSFLGMLGWANPATQIQWLVPYQGHEKLLYYELKSDPAVANKIEKISSIQDLQVAEDIFIPVPNNDKLFFYIKPIISDDHDKGFLVAEVDIPGFFNYLLSFLHMEETFFVSVHSENKLLFSNIRPVAVQDNAQILNWQKNASIIINNQIWIITINPSISMLAEKNTSTPWIVLWVGLLITVLAGIAVFFILKWQYSSKQLSITQQLNNAILNSAAYLIIATDEHGKVILFNRYAQQALGYKETEVVNKLTPVIWHDHKDVENRAKELSEELGKLILPGFEVFISKALFQGGETHEWTFIRKDGSTFPGLLVATVLYSDAGKKIGFVGIVQNLTERKNSEQQLAKYTKDLERSNYEILLLNELSNNLQACSTIEETYEPIKLYCQQALKITRGILYIAGNNSSQLESVIDWGYSLGHDKFYVNIEDCRALRQKKAYRVIDPDVDLRCKHMQSTDSLLPAYICIPIQSSFQTLGLLHIEAPKDQADFLTWSTSSLMQLMADQLALSFVSLQLRENLRQLSVHDPLTGLYNRRYLEESIKQEISNAKRIDSSFGILLMDIDYFKKINDSFGHGTGDLVLKKLSQLFLEYVRKSDIACRWGGEEFLLYFKDMQLDAIYKKANNLRLAVENLQIDCYEYKIKKMTISIGIARYPQNGLTLDSLVASADKALYEAKNTGKNKVVIANEDGNNKKRDNS